MTDDTDRIVHRAERSTSTPSTANLWVIGLLVVLVMLAGVLHPGIPLP